MHGEHIEGLLGELGITPVEMHALRALQPGRPMAITPLSQCIFVEPSNITAVLDRMSARGLVERRAQDLFAVLCAPEHPAPPGMTR